MGPIERDVAWEIIEAVQQAVYVEREWLGKVRAAQNCPANGSDHQRPTAGQRDGSAAQLDCVVPSPSSTNWWTCIAWFLESARTNVK